MTSCCSQNDGFLQRQFVRSSTMTTETHATPGPCGPNSKCREHNGLGVCSCLPDHFGNPYEGCRPECSIDSDCDRSNACERYKCVDPCPGVCGFRAECRVHNHMPMCFCPEGYKGDPFTACTPIPVTRKPEFILPIANRSSRSMSECIVYIV